MGLGNLPTFLVVNNFYQGKKSSPLFWGAAVDGLGLSAAWNWYIVKRDVDKRATQIVEKVAQDTSLSEEKKRVLARETSKVLWEVDLPPARHRASLLGGMLGAGLSGALCAAGVVLNMGPQINRTYVYSFGSSSGNHLYKELGLGFGLNIGSSINLMDSYNLVLDIFLSQFNLVYKEDNPSDLGASISISPGIEYVF